MPHSITVWPNNDADHPMAVQWEAALDAFGESFYAKPKSLPMSVQERVHLFMESRYGTFVSPDSADSHGNPSLLPEDYERFMREAEARLRHD